MDIIRGKERCLEKALDELLIIYTQNQPAYHHMAEVVPTVTLHRLEKRLTMTEFLALLGSNKHHTRGIIFDDVC